eukprot:TRINITY_DN14201_c0_g1_i1.p1 TRINITY_DN14201_c0_g1~~TRINITY_DN14201_c0_g1_i1.p1  ORF type:complete len:573 (-),score=126.09 TRINITY_DN14201_c0_g1_i1:274-1992(-)
MVSVWHDFAIRARVISKDGHVNNQALHVTAAAAAFALTFLCVLLFTQSVWSFAQLTDFAVKAPHLVASTNLVSLASRIHPAILALSAAGGISSVVFQPMRTAVSVRLTYVLGFMFFVNWLMFWMPAIVIQGAVFKLVLAPYLVPVYDIIDKSTTLRAWAARWIYEKEKHTDFFATQALFLLSAVTQLSVVFYWQVQYGELSWWMIYAYNFAWIGVGGRGMGAAYSIAHKEGHFNLYRPWIKKTVGNFFENWIGVFYGSVPYNFTTTHISLHHRLDAGRGDTLYNWDIPRGCVPSLMLYLVRGVAHCSGFGGALQFAMSPRKRDNQVCFRKLAWGCFVFWVLTPAVLCSVFNASFFFWVVVQPLFCMTFFLSIINHGFHGYIAFDKNKDYIKSVTSTTMVGSWDDYFGEDDHMAHHHHVGVYYRDLPAHQRKQCRDWSSEHASVFQGLDVFTNAVCVVLKAWPLLATRYMDFSGKLTQPQIEVMLEERAMRRDSEYSGVMPAVPWSGRTKTWVEKYEDKSLLSTVWPGFDVKARALQHWVAWKMDEGLPPLKPLEKLGFEGCAQLVAQVPDED